MQQVDRGEGGANVMNLVEQYHLDHYLKDHPLMKASPVSVMCLCIM